MRVCQLNIRSLINNKIILDNFCIDENIDVLILCETWLTNLNNTKIKNFNAIHKLRQDGYGGVSIYIRNNYISISKNIDDIEPIEAVECEITNMPSKMKFISIYIPPNIPRDTIRNNFKNLLLKYNNISNVIIAGDVNAHHSMWNSDGRQDGRGRIIADLIGNSDFVLLNNGDYTYEKLMNGTVYQSAIDITLVSQNLANNVDWFRLDHFVGSDHFPVFTEINENNNIVNHCNLSKKKLNKYIAKINPLHIFDIEDYLNTLTDAIDKSTIQSNAINSKHNPKPWWNANLQKLWNIKQAKQRIHNRHKTFYTMIQLRRASTELKYNIKLAKNISWNNFTHEINPSMNSKEIWRRINCMNGKKVKDRSTIINNAENMKKFLDYNFKVNRNIQIIPNYNNAFNDI